MMKLLTSAAVVAVAVASPSVPTFPDDWTAIEMSDSVTFQGEFTQVGTSYCCPPGSNCEVQTSGGNVKHYVDYTNKRERVDDQTTGEVIVVTYKDLHEMLVDPNTMECQSWCPITGGMEQIGLPDDAWYKGPSTYKGQPVEVWSFNETLAPKIPVIMELNDFYLARQNGTNAVPVFDYDEFTPFGQLLAVSNESWTNFMPGTPAASLFEVKNVSGCPISQNCGNGNGLRGYITRKNTLRKEARQGKAHALRAPLRKSLGLPSSSVRLATKKNLKDVPVFPVDWSANTNDFLVIYQGEYTKIGDDYCCALASNCKIQTEAEGGKLYFSPSTNQTRTNAGSQAVISDWILGKEMLVDTNNTCQSYCPLDTSQGETPPPEPLAVGPNPTDKGAITMGGKSLEWWHWADVILKKVQMDTVDFFVDQSDPSTPLPVLESMELTPFNQDLGHINSSWANFVGGPQDPSLFKVNGVDQCPLSDQC